MTADQIARIRALSGHVAGGVVGVDSRHLRVWTSQVVSPATQYALQQLPTQASYTITDPNTGLTYFVPGASNVDGPDPIK
jgi:hypothetical protein